MAWIYGDPPFSKSEKETYKKLARKLKNREFAERIVKILSVFLYLKKHKFESWKDLQESVYFDEEKTQPVFDDKTAKNIYKLLQQKGGSQYPFVNGMIESGFDTLGNTLPEIVTEPVAFVYNGATNVFTGIVDTIPFADILLELGKSGASVATVTIENIAGAFGGAPGEIVAFVLTFMIAAAAASVHILERDFGGAIEQMFRAIPVVGATMQTMLQKGEALGQKVDKDYENIKAQFSNVSTALSNAASNIQIPDRETVKAKLMDLKPSDIELAKAKLQEYRSRIPKQEELEKLKMLAKAKLQEYKTAGKRLKTIRHTSDKWHRKTQRRK